MLGERRQGSGGVLLREVHLQRRKRHRDSVRYKSKRRKCQVSSVGGEQRKADKKEKLENFFGMKDIYTALQSDNILIPKDLIEQEQLLHRNPAHGVPLSRNLLGKPRTKQDSPSHARSNSSASSEKPPSTSTRKASTIEAYLQRLSSSMATS